MWPLMTDVLKWWICSWPLKKKNPHIPLRPFDHLDHCCCSWTCWVILPSVCLGTDAGFLVLQDTTQHICSINSGVYVIDKCLQVQRCRFMGKSTVFRIKSSYLNVFYRVISSYKTFKDVRLDRWFALNMVLKGWRRSWEDGWLLHKNKFKGRFQRRLCQPLSFYAIESFSLNFIRRKHVKMSDGSSLHSSIHQLLQYCDQMSHRFFFEK